MKIHRLIPVLIVLVSLVLLVSACGGKGGGY
jgi:predicted small secreted protein